MLSFECDYNFGAHPAILEQLTATNLTPQPGYGQDAYTAQATEKIKAAFGCPQGRVFFLCGGTQTNQLIIDTLLRPFEGVIACQSGHIAVHEAGAIEYTGHKVLTLPSHQGKVAAADVQELMIRFLADPTREHTVHPGMVYISHPTEWGTLYTKEELTALSAVCRQYHLPLYLDGARLGYGLMSPATDVTPEDIARLCDVFYIGGTKMGALCGEAAVFPGGNPPAGFFTMIKQHGALLAKGRLLGVQFDTLFTDGLYFTIGRQAIQMAEQLKALFVKKGYPLAWDSPTNQQFVVLDDQTLTRLEKAVRFEIWERLEPGNTVVRFCTSFATTKEDLARLEALL